MEKGDLRYNYLAVLACILGEDVSIDAAVAIIVDGKKYTKRYKNKGNKTASRRIVLIDKLTNTRREFKCQGDASKYLGVARGIAGVYAKSGKIYKDRYKFEHIGED